MQTYRAVEKYLSRYSEPECQSLANFPGLYQQGLLIPVYQESPEAFDYFCQFVSAQPGTLLTLVVNRPDHDHDVSWAKAFVHVSKPLAWQSTNGTLSLYTLPEGSALLIIDRCLNGDPIPQKQGVGLARKIGADILCTLIANGQIQSPWIYNTDADATLPDQYFSALNTIDSHTTAAVTYPFKHIFKDTELPKAPTQLYELSLHYYVEGLRMAGSPYAYHTIGSIIAVNFRSYAMVRGFPKRSAAEDFYLLNKLRKTGDISNLKYPLIELTARESTRVPFGTGPAVKDLAEQEDLFSTDFYHPDSFVYLKAFLKLLEEVSTHDEAIALDLLTLPHDIDKTIFWTVLKAMNFQEALAHSLKHGTNAQGRLQHLHHWFDGFKTLKFIHHLRNDHLGTLSFRELCAKYSENMIIQTLKVPPSFKVLFDPLLP